MTTHERYGTGDASDDGDRSDRSDLSDRGARSAGGARGAGGAGGDRGDLGVGNRRSDAHDAVGAYALGILDDPEATAFEEHLAGCAVCAAHLDEFTGMEPMLALLADGPDGPDGADHPGAPRTPGPPAPPAPPGAALLDRLVGEVAVQRGRRKRRRVYAIAAAVALIVGGPLIAIVASSEDTGGGRVSDEAFLSRMKEKVHATDATTQVSATIGLDPKGWGTDTVLRLTNVRGPLKCRLIAVSRTGEEDVVTSWAVPAWGYGIPGSPYEAATSPLYIHGGTALDSGDIDHFEVRTFDGKRLVEVGA
ncbi:zf-HC2 domain-containing protein [Streptomyces sp. NPDC051569]|uniref:zf-HC2 domain-containing protein n=1 Tax=Streptomyces sp. NPDC051569 TaxID=3365661 RepID=UPI00378F7641